MDRRVTPANDRVAHKSVAALFPDRRPVAGELRSVRAPVTDLCRAPNGARDSQLLLGETLRVLEDKDGWAFVLVPHDGYVGYVRSDVLGPVVEATFMVAHRTTHLYPEPDVKAREIAALSFGSRLRIVSETGRFLETHEGAFVPKPHLRGLGQPFSDPVTVAQLFFGTPYLWGGTSGFGIDCSGLVQIALRASGHPCPRDSDMQEAGLGAAVEPDTPVRRGDLFFWKGHVAIAVDGETLLHANAHHMSVAYEPIATAIRRIDAAGEGPVTSRRRLQSLGLSS